MPQDKRRSISYRSFVTCDDPKGVECGVIRKSKLNSQKKEQNIIVGETIKEGKHKKEMGITRGIESTTPVTFQLLEVSKDAQKLNHVINSWASENKFKGNPNKSNNIAKDLLKGALDLQESLVMLEKLQEKSSYVMGLSRKERQKLEDCTFDGMVGEVKGFERSRIGRCSRSSFDEMRNVVRESLLRQNVMIANPIFEANRYHCDVRKMDSPDLMPSSSSSRSSMVCSSNFVPSDSSVSSSIVSRKKKGKDLNLIVKLMGLESFPSSPRKCAPKEKFVNLEKPMYDNESPRAKRVQFGVQGGGMKQRSVEEILENLKFKGVLRNGFANGLTSQESDVFVPKNERTPIVVMKPMQYPCLDLPTMWDETHMKPRYDVGGRVDGEEKGKSSKKIASTKVKDSGNSHLKPLKKQEEVTKGSKRDKVITSTRRKGEEKKEAKLNDQEKCVSEKSKRKKDSKPITKNPISSLQKANFTSVPDPGRKRGTMERKKNRQQALVLEEKRICKSEIEDTKAFSTEDNESRDDSKSSSPAVGSISVDNNEKGRIQIKEIGEQIYLEPREGISYDVLTDENIARNDDNQSVHSAIASVSTSKYCSVDQLGETQSPLNEVTLSTTHENGIAVQHDTNHEETKTIKCVIESPRKTEADTLTQCFSPRTKLKSLLLSNSLFVSHVEELFSIQYNPDLVPCVKDVDQDLESSRVLIDCSKEILELKHQQLSQACLPLPPNYTIQSRSSITLDRLLEEVYIGIDELGEYLRPVSDDFPSDNLYSSLDRDLRYRSGVWGVGWSRMYTQDEVERVIGEVDRFVLSKLIEEVIVDFML